MCLPFDRTTVGFTALGVAITLASLGCSGDAQDAGVDGGGGAGSGGASSGGGPASGGASSGGASSGGGPASGGAASGGSDGNGGSGGSGASSSGGQGGTATGGGDSSGGSSGSGGGDQAPRAELTGTTACELLTDCCTQSPRCFDSDMLNEFTCETALRTHMSSMECGPVLEGSITVTLDSERAERSYSCTLSDPPRSFLNGTDDLAVWYQADTDTIRIDCSTDVVGEGALRIVFPAQTGQHASDAQIVIGSETGIDWYRAADGENGAILVTNVTSYDAASRRLQGTFSGQMPLTTTAVDQPATIAATFDVAFPDYPDVP